MSEFESSRPREKPLPPQTPEILDDAKPNKEPLEPPSPPPTNNNDSGSDTNDNSSLSAPQRRLKQMGMASMQGNVDTAQEESSVVDTSDTTDTTQPSE